MTTIAAIRTHHWGEDAQRVYDQLRPVFGDNLVTVFHNRPEGLELPLPVVDIDDAWVAANGLRVLPDWGWRCGDYFLYALRQAIPAADYYWLIEPDVFFTGPVADLFAKVAGRGEDLLGVRIEPMEAGHRFGRGMPGVPLWRAIFALTRFSGRAADRLFAARQVYRDSKLELRFYTNDETFCFSTALADATLSHANLCDIAPEWFAQETMRTDPDVLLDTLIAQTAPGAHHPVRARASFKRGLVDRLTNNTGYLKRMSASLGCLSPEDIDDIAAEVARRSRETLMHHRPRAKGAVPPEMTEMEKTNA